MVSTHQREQRDEPVVRGSAGNYGAAPWLALVLSLDYRQEASRANGKSLPNPKLFFFIGF